MGDLRSEGSSFVRGSTRRRMLRAGAVGAIVKLCGNTTVDDTVARQLMAVTLRCLACALADGGGRTGNEQEQEEKSDGVDLSAIGEEVEDRTWVGPIRAAHHRSSRSAGGVPPSDVEATRVATKTRCRKE